MHSQYDFILHKSYGIFETILAIHHLITDSYYGVPYRFILK